MTTITKENFREILSKRSIDPDTKIKSTRYIEDSLFLLIERWNWDGVAGSTAVAYTPQLKEREEDVFVSTVCGILNMEIPERGKYTVSMKDDYSYFNFDFAS